MPDFGLELGVAGDRLRFQLHSRVRNGAIPLVVVYASDGSCGNAELEPVLNALSSWCAAATPDLPLCGARASDKLTAAAYDPQHVLSKSLLGDVRLQLRDDLRALVEHLAETRSVDRDRAAVLAWGRGALALRDVAPGACGLKAVECVESAEAALERCEALRRAL